MRKRSEVHEPAQETVELEAGDAINEMILIAAAMIDPQARGWLVHQARPEHFLLEDNRHVWAGLQEIERRKLDYSHAVLAQLVGNRLKSGYAEKLLGQFPESPDRLNLEHHVKSLKWDHQRAHGIKGPLAELLEALRDPTNAQERVGVLARSVGSAFSGGGSNWLEDPRFLVEQQIDDVKKRAAGRATWPYGVRNLDFYERGARNARGEDVEGRARCVPGAKPGQVTVLTAHTKGGKSTLAARITLGLADQGRKVMYGAWEPGSGMTIELLATMSLGWSRTDTMEGRMAPEDIVALEEKMHELLKTIVLMKNPFQRSARGSDKLSNDRNLDIVHQHIVDSGCEVWFADLWDRLLVDQRPDQVKNALWRTAAICEETSTHGIALVQQKIKGEDQRADHRPSIGNIFGSSEWAYVASTIIAPHRPALFKNIADNKMEIALLAQRWGTPQMVEFDWDAEFGSIEGGITKPIEHADDAGGLAEFVPPTPSGGRRKRR